MITVISELDGRVVELTADDADLHRYHACHLRPSVSSVVNFLRASLFVAAGESGDRQKLSCCFDCMLAILQLSSRLQENMGGEFVIASVRRQYW